MAASTFGARLRELRESAGLTQAQLAETAGLSKAGIADLEQGRREPSWATAIALAVALGVDCRAFLQPPHTDTVPRGRGRPRSSPRQARKKRPKRS